MNLKERLNQLLSFAPWTFGLSLVIVLMNLGTVTTSEGFFKELLVTLDFDREAIAQGEVWRLLTGNLVHWSFEHFALDLVAFLFVGILFERRIGSVYPMMLLISGLAVGCSIYLFSPSIEFYRGLSGVDSGQFAVAVLSEGLRSKSKAQLAFPLLLGIGLILKLAYECFTGELLFSTGSLGYLGDPTPIAHFAGTVGAFVGVIRFPKILQGSDTKFRKIEKC